MSAWTDYVESMLPASTYLYQATGLPAWLTTAMAAHESGVPPASDSTHVIDNNPWGVRCWNTRYPCSQFDFLIYPNVLSAAADLVGALGPSRLQYASNPRQFLQDLATTGWEGPPAEETGYPASVLNEWAPPAKVAFSALGLNPTTGLALSTPPPTPTTVAIPGTGPVKPNWGGLIGISVALGVPLGVYVALLTPRGQAWARRHGLERY